MVERPINIRQGDFTIRRATPSDFQAVIDIDDNIRDGLDYMPLMFHQFLQSRHHLMLVTEHEEKIIGLVNYRFSDDQPRSVIRMSVRLARNWRGLGYGGHKYLDQQLLNLFPQISEVVFTKEKRFYAPESANVLNQWIMRLLDEMAPATAHDKIFSPRLYKDFNPSMETSAQTCLNYRFAGHPLSNRLADFRSTTVSCTPMTSETRPLTYPMVDTLLTTSDSLECFFLAYYDMYVPVEGSCRPMKIDKRQLKELFATASWSLITDDMDDITEFNTNINTGDGRAFKPTTPRVGTIRSLSYSYFNPVKFGLACDLFFFGNDPQQAIRHAIGHAEHLATVWNGNVAFLVHVPTELDVVPIDATLQLVFSGPAQLEPCVIAFRRLPALEADLQLV